ncbi:MAG TPA: multicopper oxidase family protein [Rhodocyclaceae bacterium]|nr:multicopper oxidase family protein [Rhodocyclaceae bacterium]
MRDTKSLIGRLLSGATVAFASLLAAAAHAASPGITGPSFDLTAGPGYVSQPDGSSVYSWGYGCNTAPSGYLPATIPGASCSTMQLPGPTLIVNQGDSVSVTLHNNLPAAAGNTSILFPGFDVSTSGGAPGILTREALVGGTVTYNFTAPKPGTYTYYSGTRGDLQVEMGLYGALIVLPTLNGGIPTGYTTPTGYPVTCHAAGATLPNGHPDFRLSSAAYNHPSACYDREYLFQFSEIDPVIHRQAEEQAGLPCTQTTGCMVVATEPYVPAYFMVNGRSMPDLMDPNYAVQYPHQPYNGNPHMHPGELVLLRIIGTGRWQHPFHEHGNHVRVLARDGNLMLTPSSNKLAGPLLFTTTTTPGQTIDGIFQWTGKGLNWDVYAHTTGHTEPCIADNNGYYTTGSGAAPTAPNYYEWCADHEKPLESKPFGQVGSGGPVTLPDPNIFANGPWYGGSPYLGPDATQRSVGSTPIPPSGTVSNSPTEEAGYAFMWHSHNEREITTNNAFPGGMMMMMLVDPWVFTIVEAN